jgi:arsenate reductase (glutaredoxin)
VEKINVYEKPTCTTCRKVNKILFEKGFTFDKIDYFVHPFSRNKLKSLLNKMDISAQMLLRKNNSIYKELDLAHKKYTDDEIIDLLVMHPDLVERPIVEKGSKAVLARPPEKVLELFE